MCSALAWQRYNQRTNNNNNDGGDNNDNNKVTKIFYCCRTHSQVKQMVASLKNTPYRPRMTVLGSRDRMCIHTDIINNNGNRRKSGSSANVSCQIRVRNTEKYRKQKFRNTDDYYNDDSPIDTLPGDYNNNATSISFNDVDDADDDDTDEDNTQKKKSHKTCPHYRQLTRATLAKRIRAMHIPPNNNNNNNGNDNNNNESNQNNEGCNCSSLVGGEKTKFGVHDIEDLVAFGKNTSVMRGIAIYRHCDSSSTDSNNKSSFGIKLSQPKFGGSIMIDSVRSDEAAEREGTLKDDDTIVRVNHQDVSRNSNINFISSKIRALKKDQPLILDVLRRIDDENDEYNLIDNDDTTIPTTSACPYYLSRTLVKDADLIFAPHNYVLDPGIRSAMNIKLDNSIVILDEAHNVENTLRDMSSVKYNDIDLMNMSILLQRYASRDSAFNHKPFGVSNNIKNFHASEGDMMGNGEQKDPRLPGIAHQLLIFVEDIIFFLKESLSKFENDQGKNEYFFSFYF